MAISTDNAVLDAKRRMEAALSEDKPITVPKAVLQRLVRAIEEPCELVVEPATDLEELVRRYGVALLAHDRDEMHHCGKVWPDLLRVREELGEVARKMAEEKEMPQ